MIRLFVVDDHPLVRIGMTWVLETQKDFRVVGEAPNGGEALAAIARRRVDVVLCDFHRRTWMAWKSPAGCWRSIRI